MNLLIHDLTPEEWERIAENYKDWNVISDNGSIRPCIGCFRCWTSGTGECAFEDGYHRMSALIHEADEVVVMSRYTYGGFSSFVKNVFDRSIGYVAPEFETAYGEMHHRRRYPEEKPVTFRFRSTGLTEEDKEKAWNYVAAVCRNLRGTVRDVLFEDCEPSEESGIPTREPAERSGILLIDCSLRGKRSNTAVFLKKVQENLECPAELISLSSGIEPKEAAEKIRRARTIVLGVPLYVDGIPASALRLMETIRKLGAGDKCRLYAVVNNGLYESRQNANLLGMIRDFCAGNGILYQGAAAIGAGEVMGVLMRNAKHSLWPARNAKRSLTKLAKAAGEDRAMGEVFADPFLFPRRLYILIANRNWQRLKRSAQEKHQ